MIIMMEKHLMLKHTNIIKTYNNNLPNPLSTTWKTNGLKYPLTENRFINNNTKSFYILIWTILTYLPINFMSNLHK